jgi:hypothetical protein
MTTALNHKLHLVHKVAAQKSGATVTFTFTNPGTYTASTDTWSGATTSTVTGTMERVRGDPERYTALELVESEAPTFEFVPDTLGELPALNSVTTFGDVVFSCRDITPNAPSGTAYSARLILVR